MLLLLLPLPLLLLAVSVVVLLRLLSSVDDVIRVAIATCIDVGKIEDGGDEESGNTEFEMDTARNKSIDREEGETGDKIRWRGVNRAVI